MDKLFNFNKFRGWHVDLRAMKRKLNVNISSNIFPPSRSSSFYEGKNIKLLVEILQMQMQINGFFKTSQKLTIENLW